LPFSDETAIAAQNRAMVPARICIDNKICIVSFPLNSGTEFYLIKTAGYAH